VTTPTYAQGPLKCYFFEGSDAGFLIPHIPPFYRCDATEIVVAQPNVTVFLHDSAHVNESANSDVTFFYASELPIHYIPHGLSEIFQNLETFFVTKCGLLEITQSDLRPLSMLRDFVVPANRIATIPAHLFKFNRHLRLANFDENPLKIIDGSAFDGLDRLVSLSFFGIDGARVSINDTVFGSREGVLRLVQRISQNLLKN
jgi:hypothetical protein